MQLKITRDTLYRLDDAHAGDVVLDLSEMDFVTGAALGKMVKLHTKLKTKGRKLVVQNVTPDVLEIFEVTGLSGLLNIGPAAA